jgi:hypothetical protein
LRARAFKVGTSRRSLESSKHDLTFGARTDGFQQEQRASAAATRLAEIVTSSTNDSILGDPILGDGFPRHSKIELLLAYHLADQVLQSVLSLGIPCRLDSAVRLQP